jgi:hypothetical protein
MCKLVEMIDAGNPLVNQSMRAVIKYGWDSIHWQRGYSILHFAAECLNNPDIVELLALLANDMSARDNSGKRPLDYARKERKWGNVRALERVRDNNLRKEIDNC